MSTLVGFVVGLIVGISITYWFIQTNKIEIISEKEEKEGRKNAYTA